MDKGSKANAGVVQKLAGQVDALISIGWEVDYMIHDGLRIYKNQKIIAEMPRGLGVTGTKWFFWKHLLPAFDKGYDLFLIRYSLMIPPQFDFIRSIRQVYPQSKIILDMPTYPYDDEWTGLKGRLGLYWDRKYRAKLAPYIDGITHSGSEESIFNIRTIPITNGIAEYLIAQSTVLKKSSDTLNLVAVGKWQFWHGLDRLIKGMSTYLDLDHQSTVHLHIAGEGPESRALNRLVAELGLDNSITFHGALLGEPLLSLLDQADIAIGTLGLHRKNVDLDSSLKHRLYSARGIPMLLSSRDEDFDPQLPFVFYTNPDESDIDIDALIEWYDRLDREEVTENMTTFAKNHLTWNIKMKKLLASL